MINKFDIFISYARKDFGEVNEFVGMLKERIPSLTCWFDVTGIESGDEFEDKIITAINNSSYVLFALSDYSIQSQWTKDEVMYAKNTNKKVIPLLLKEAELKDWFLFKFGRIDCIDTTNSLQIEKLVKNLSDWTGKALTSASASELSPHSSKVPEQPRQEVVMEELHEAVDLGLSVKWATCNVGADIPEDCGDFFAWGETEPKYDSSWKTYKWCRRKFFCLFKYMTKYSNDKESLAFDNKLILEPEDDVAHVEWGGGWRMPTIEEFEELCEKCKWKWLTIDDVEGSLVTGPNGNSIFLPDCIYWSASLEENDCDYAHYALLCGTEDDEDADCYDLCISERCHSYNVRPVCD